MEREHPRETSRAMEGLPQTLVTTSILHSGLIHKDGVTVVQMSPQAQVKAGEEAQVPSVHPVYG